MEERVILPTPDGRQKRLALMVALLVPVPFVAIIPIGQVQLPRVDSYIPVVDTVMIRCICNDKGTRDGVGSGHLLHDH